MQAIAITLGDPSGVGPEITCRALAHLPPAERAATWVIGDPETLARADRLVNTGLQFTEYAPRDGAVRVVPVIAPEADTIRPGKLSAGGGHAAHACVARAVELAMHGDIAVIVTAPLNKAALHAAGFHHDGHTELLQELSGASSSFMLLTSPKLATVHVSTHVSLLEAVARATIERVLATIRAGHAHLQELGIRELRIAVAGLNPHCGEGGLFGNDEAERIAPAVRAARELGIDVRGPLPGDTVFYRAVQGEFDLVVAQYHDQGHIPTKLIAFDSTVNVTLGLPIRRTSVDHGTAFDIAWRGQADHTNMLAALAYARRMTRRA